MQIRLPSYLSRMHAGDDPVKFSMDKKAKSSGIATKNSTRCSQKFSNNTMMGILGNRDLYVCNQIRSIRANLSNVPGAIFHTTLVSKLDNTFWSASRRRRMFGQSTHGGDEQGVGETHTLQKRADYANALGDDSGGSGTGSDDVRDDGDDGNVGGDGNLPVESSRRRAKEYTVPHNSRPGQRCASAKAELGDDLLTVVAVLPTRPFDFETRRFLRELLSKPARKLRSRQYYRKIKTSDKPKRRKFFDWYVKHDKNLNRDFRGVQNTNYSSYKWGWNLKVFDEPSADPRAVCIDVMFQVGDQRRLHCALTTSSRPLLCRQTAFNIEPQSEHVFVTCKFHAEALFVTLLRLHLSTVTIYLFSCAHVPGGSQ